MARHAARGISTPPEVVVDTATGPGSSDNLRRALEREVADTSTAD
jgi:hypothetical protein